MVAESAAPSVRQQVHFVLVCVGLLVAVGNLGDFVGAPGLSLHVRERLCFLNALHDLLM